MRLSLIILILRMRFVIIFMATLSAVFAGMSSSSTGLADPSEVFVARGDDFYRQKAYGLALQNYLFALEISPALAGSFEMNFKIGQATMETGQLQDAIPYLRNAAADPQFGDYGLFQWARVMAAMDSTIGSTNLYETLLRRFPNSVFRMEASIALTLVSLKDGRTDRAEELLQMAAASVPDKSSMKAQFKPRLELLKGMVYESRANAPKAIATWRLLQKEFPYANEALEARSLLADLRKRLRLPVSGEQFIEANNVLILQGLYRQALNELAAARNRYSSSDMQRQIEMSIARIYFSQGLYLAAIPRYRTLWKKYGHKESLFHMARAARYAGDLDLSTRAYQDYLRHGALSTNWRNYILFEMANNYSAKSDTASLREANRLYRLVRQNAPLVTLYGYSSAFREGFNHYKLGEYQSAIDRFSEIEKKLDFMQTRCRFWSAKAYERLNRPDEALRLYTDLAEKRYSDYYGMMGYFLSRHDTTLARQYFYTGFADTTRRFLLFQRAGQPPVDFDRSILARVTGEDSIMKRARVAGDLLGPYIAERELRAQQESFFRTFEGTSRLKAAAEALRCYDVAVDASTVLATTYKNKFTGLFEQYALTFPQYYAGLIEYFSSRSELDAPLVYAVIKRESAFRSHVISSARAVGLMQVMPFTGNEIAQELHLDEFDMMTLQNPEESIRLGTYYLWKQSVAFKGYVPAILAAYNAGPHRAEFWMKQHNDLDPMEFPEVVELLETNNYIKRILLDRWIYSQLYPS